MKIEMDPREVAELVLSAEFLARPGLHSGDAGKAAQKLVESRDDVFVACFVTMASDQNTLRTKREWARRAGVTFTQFRDFWKRMRAASIKGTDGKKRRLFRPRVELLAEARGGEAEGGVGLHLARKGAVAFGLNKRIALSWAPTQFTINETVAGAMDRMAEDTTASLEERVEAERALEAARAVLGGPTLPLFERTGTNDAG
jgi:hypothetical protein